MNRIKIIMLSMLAVAVLFSSCKDDEPDDVITPTIGPALTLTPTSVEGWIGDTVSIAYSIATQTANEIVSLDITTNESQIESEFYGEELDNNAVNDTFDFIMPATNSGNAWLDGQSFEVEFIAVHEVDGIQYSTTKTVVVTYIEPEDPLTEFAGGIINNLIGQQQGAWNLDLDEGVSEGGAAAVKDMRNTTTLSSAGPEIFETEWDSPAGSTFVLTTWDANGYASVTPEMIAAEYAAGTPVSTVSDVQEGQVYVAEIRGMGIYTAIIITDVNVTSGAGDNTDSISFSYKK